MRAAPLRNGLKITTISDRTHCLDTRPRRIMPGSSPQPAPTTPSWLSETAEAPRKPPNHADRPHTGNLRACCARPPMPPALARFGPALSAHQRRLGVTILSKCVAANGALLPSKMRRQHWRRFAPLDQCAENTSLTPWSAEGLIAFRVVVSMPARFAAFGRLLALPYHFF